MIKRELKETVKTEEVHCILCGSPNGIRAIEEGGYTGLKCLTCNLIYISPKPTYSHMLGRYVQDQASNPAEAIIGDDLSKRLLARHTLSLIQRCKRTGSLLEIGAGAGYFLDEARKKGFSVFGIEINKVEAEFIAESLGIPCERVPLSESSFGGRQFDIIYHCNVLSHLHDPVAEFRKINDHLQEGGFHIFETGNLGDVESRYYRLFQGFEYPDHLFFFGEESLKQLVRMTRFELIKIYDYSIVSQLLLSKMINFISRFFSRSATSRSSAESDEHHWNPHRQRTGLKRLGKVTRAYLFYLLTYRMKLLWRRKSHPKTLIVLAQKAR